MKYRKGEGEGGGIPMSGSESLKKTEKKEKDKATTKSIEKNSRGKAKARERWTGMNEGRKIYELLQKRQKNFFTDITSLRPALRT